jgi:mannose-6-phosphate isomerase
MGLELMNNSDNVIRGGLTGKYTDLGELFDILDFAEYKPEILKTPNPRPLWFTYPSPSEDFSLSVIHGSANTVYYSETGPSILLITEGTAAVSGARGELILKAGESFFIPAGKKPDLAFAGSFTAYAAAAGKEQNTVR